MNPRRRDVLKTAGVFGGLVIGGKGVQEGGREIRDVLNGRCDTHTDELRLGPGDAAVYRQDNQSYYLEHIDKSPGDGINTEVRFGPVGTEKKTITLGYDEQPETPGITGFSEESADTSLDFHVNLGDAATGGDVVEPRG
ncbi:MAG: hypothetical protein SVU88_02835, partial [Candidatus Nanohaloarchaea archaeon]|nr:hypothetical protein [Candidatus Nanohaloarchaea archaeon]